MQHTYGEESEESIHLIAQTNHVVMIRTQRRRALNAPTLLRENSFADRMHFPVSPMFAENEETRMTPGNGFASRNIFNASEYHLSSHLSNDSPLQLRGRDQLYTEPPCNDSLPSNRSDHRRQLSGTRSSFKRNDELPAVYNSSGNRAIHQFPNCVGKLSVSEGAFENSNASRVGVRGATASDPEIITLSSDSEPSNDAFGNSSSTVAALPLREIEEPRAKVSPTDLVNLDANCEATSSDVVSSPPRAGSSSAAAHACRDTAAQVDEEPREGAKKMGVTKEDISENKEKQGEEERGVEDNCSKEEEKRKESEEILNYDERSEKSREQTCKNHDDHEEDEDDDDDEEMDEKERNEEGDEDYFSNDSTSDITIMGSDRMSFGASDSCHVSIRSSSYVEELNESETRSWHSSILLDRSNDHEGPSNDLENVDDEDEESPGIDAKTAGRFSKEDGPFIATEEKVAGRESDIGSGPNGKEERNMEEDESGEELSGNLEDDSIENVSDDEGVSDESAMSDNVDHIEKNQLNNNRNNEKLRHPSKYSVSSKKCEISPLNRKGKFLGTPSKNIDDGEARIFGSHGFSDFRGFADFRDGSPFDRTPYSCDLSYRCDGGDVGDVTKSTEFPVAPVERTRRDPCERSGARRSLRKYLDVGCTVLNELFAAMTLHEGREDLSSKRKREEEAEFQNMWKKLKISADCEARAIKASPRRSRRRQFRICGLPVDRKTIEEIGSIGRTRSETRSLVSFDATEKNALNCDGAKEIFESVVKNHTERIPKEASSGASRRRRSANIDSPIVSPPTSCDAPREACVVKRKRNHSRTSSGEDSKDCEDLGTVPNGTTKKRSVIRKLNDAGIMFMKRAEVMVARGRADREKHIEGSDDNSPKSRKISSPSSESTGEIYGGMPASEKKKKKKKETKGDSSSSVAAGASASNGKFIDDTEMAVTPRSTPERISNLRAALNVSSLEESVEGEMFETSGKKAEVLSKAKTKETSDFEIDSELEVFKEFDNSVEFARSKARFTRDEVDEASMEWAVEDIPNFQENSVISPSKSLTSRGNVETPLGVDTGNFPDCGTVTGSQELEDPVKRSGLREKLINDKEVRGSNLQRILKTSPSKKSTNGQKYNSAIKVGVEKLADPWTGIPAPKIMSTHEERSQGKVNSRRKVASKESPSKNIAPLRKSRRISEIMKNRGTDSGSLPCFYKGRD